MTYHDRSTRLFDISPLEHNSQISRLAKRIAEITGQAVEFVETGLRGIRRSAFPVFVHYMTGNGAPKDLDDFSLGRRLERHPQVQQVLAQIHRELTERSVEHARSICARQQRATRLHFQYAKSFKIDVKSDPELTFVGNTTVECDARVSLTVNCSQGLLTAEAPLNFQLRDAFVDALDILNNMRGNQDIPGSRPFKLTHRWRIPFLLPGAPFNHRP